MRFCTEYHTETKLIDCNKDLASSEKYLQFRVLGKLHDLKNKNYSYKTCFKVYPLDKINNKDITHWT